MIEGLASFQNVFKIPELKRRVIFTTILLVAYLVAVWAMTAKLD